MREIIIDKNHMDMRLDRFALRVLGISKGEIQKGIRTKKIKVNGKKKANNYRLQEGDIVSFYFSDELFKEEGEETKKGNIGKLDILFENENVLIVNKNAGILSQGNSSGDISIVDMAKEYLKTSQTGVITRLDRNTSGIVIIGKNRRALMLLNEMSRKNLIEKEYITLVKGKFELEGKITHYGKKGKNKLMLYDREGEGLSEVSSIFEPIKYFNGYTLLKVNLITGKTHQIRSQIEKLGYGVVGDRKYDLHNKEKALEKKVGLKRQFLHCGRVVIRCSGEYKEINKEDIEVNCKLSGELERCVGAAGASVARTGRQS